MQICTTMILIVKILYHVEHSFHLRRRFARVSTSLRSSITILALAEYFIAMRILKQSKTPRERRIYQALCKEVSFSCISHDYIFHNLRTF